MTSQDPWRQIHTLSKITMEMCGRVCRVPRGRTVSCFLAFFGLFPDLSLSHCFFRSFFLFVFFFEIERFQFPFLVSLLFLFVLVHGHFCSVVVGVSISQPPFPSSQHFLRKIHKHDECWLQGDLLVTCTIWRNESATLTQLCQNTSFRRLQVCCRGGSAAGGQQANTTRTRSWNPRWNPRSRMKTTRTPATSLPI